MLGNVPPFPAQPKYTAHLLQGHMASRLTIYYALTWHGILSRVQSTTFLITPSKYVFLTDLYNMAFYFVSSYAPVICIPGSLGAGDSGDIAGPKCRDLTFYESRQCRRCDGVLISRQSANLCHILTIRGKLSLYI